jgi:hypothetical protein
MTNPFFPRGEGCTLRFVRNRPANWIIAALLMFQLAIGLQWQTAQAVVAQPEQQMHGMEAGHCPTHSSGDSSIAQGRSAAGAPTSAPSSHNHPAGKHDCCNSLGCQCHCAQSPTALARTLVSPAVSTSVLLPILNARPPVARSNELFRPPIA